MSSKQQSSRQSKNAFSSPAQSSMRLLIISKVSIAVDLSHDYLGIEKVSQVHDRDRQPISAT